MDNTTKADKAIVTKFIPQTTYKSARIKATSYNQSKTITYSHEGERSHREAMLALVKDMEWDVKLELVASCELPNNQGYVWLFNYVKRGE